MGLLWVVVVFGFALIFFWNIYLSDKLLKLSYEVEELRRGDNKLTERVDFPNARIS